MHLVLASNPLTLPSWLTAIFTGVLALGAIITAVFAIMAFRKQSVQVGLLEEQARREQQGRRRETEERRWREAVLVYLTASFDAGWRPPPGGLPIGPINVGPAAIASVHNTSGQPVYDVRVHWVDSGKGSQAGEHDQVGTVGPGEDKQSQRTMPAGTAADQFIPVAYFRDAAGLRWTVLPDGHLAPVDASLHAGAPLIATTAVARSVAAPPEPAARPAPPKPFRQRVREAVRVIRRGSR